MFIESENIPKDSGYIGNLDACDTDDETDKYLQSESHNRRNMDARLVDCIEVIDKAHEADDCCKPNDNLELILEEGREVKAPRDNWCKYEQDKDKDNPY